MTVFAIEVVADVVCPFCFIGKRKLEQAIAVWKKANADDSFVVTWRAFYLNPNPPPTSVPIADYLRKKTGMTDISPMLQRMEQLGKPCGIQFKPGGKIGSTRDAHRLIYLAQNKVSSLNIRNALIEGLYVAHHENAKDISSHDILREVAVGAGIEAQEVDAWLNSDLGGQEVDREFQQAQAQGVAGVPYLTIQGKHHIRGAQDVSNFVNVFSKVKEAAQ